MYMRKMFKYYIYVSYIFSIKIRFYYICGVRCGTKRKKEAGGEDLELVDVTGNSFSCIDDK